MKSPSPLVLLSVPLLLSLSAIVPGAQQARPRQIRVAGPDTLQHGMRYALAVEGLMNGTNWELLAPEQFRVKVSGAARALDDPAGRPMNPFEIRCADGADGKVTVEITAGDHTATRTFAVGTAKPAGTFEAVIQPRTVTHRFAGLGGGVMFYDNQFDITTGDDIYDWCFRDVHATFLHVLIRPDYEKENDNEDWRSLDLAKFDFRSLERPFRIIKKALERNPKLKIYASLYSPPAWLKNNGSTGGQGSLRDGLRSRQELAEYVFAYLKHARGQGIPVHYVGFFNEPDFAHTQEGMYFADLGTLVETFSQCARALDTLLAADPTMKERPIYVFPDSLGAGSITRAGKNSQRVRERVRLLDRVGVWGVHDYWNQTGTYWNDRFRELRAFPGVGKKPIWMTEWAQRFPRGDLASGVEFGVHILNALRLGAEAWMVFEWCHPAGNQSGLLSTDWGAKAPRARYWRSKAYHVFRQIANTTPAGAQVVSMSVRRKGTNSLGADRMEYLALRDGDSIIVHLMNHEPVPVEYRISLAGAKEKAEAWLTTPLDDMAKAGAEALTVGRPGDTSTVRGVIPGSSLLSFVLRGTGK